MNIQQFNELVCVYGKLIRMIAYEMDAVRLISERSACIGKCILNVVDLHRSFSFLVIIIFFIVARSGRLEHDLRSTLLQ